MMRCCFWSLDGTTCVWPRRLVEEGGDVLLYVQKDRKNIIGRGIIPVAESLEAWLAWGRRDPSTVFFFDQTDAGDLADRLRREGRRVLNGGSFMDRLELDRHWGEQLATSCGVLAPPTKRFSSISAAVAYLKTNPAQAVGDGGWAWKPDADIGTDATIVAKDAGRVIEHVQHIARRHRDGLSCILQEKVDGVAVSSARWWNGRAWCSPTQGTIENKKLLDGGLGPATGCSFNVVWWYIGAVAERIDQALRWDALAEVFRREGAPAGLYDINAMLNAKGAYFLEWTPRLGVDSEVTSQRAIKNLSAFVEAVVDGGDAGSHIDHRQAYFDVRLTVPPYPTDPKVPGYESPAIGVPVRGIDGLTTGTFVMGQLGWSREEGFTVADSYGMLGYAVTSGRSVAGAYEKLYTWIKDNLQVPDLQYRTDAAKVLQEDIDAMHKFGWPTPPILRR